MWYLYMYVYVYILTYERYSPTPTAVCAGFNRKPCSGEGGWSGTPGYANIKVSLSLFSSVLFS